MEMLWSQDATSQASCALSFPELLFAVKFADHGHAISRYAAPVQALEWQQLLNCFMHLTRQ